MLPTGCGRHRDLDARDGAAVRDRQAAAIGQFAAGKTGTTSNFGDAWFVGWDKKYTVAVWVGYPNKLVPMTTDFGGQPVFGGTFPALIWHDFMLAAMQVEQARANRTTLAKAAKEGAKEATSGAQEATSPAEAGAGGGSSSGRATGGAGGGSSTPGQARRRSRRRGSERRTGSGFPDAVARHAEPHAGHTGSIERKLEIGRRRSHRRCQPEWVVQKTKRRAGAARGERPEQNDPNERPEASTTCAARAGKRAGSRPQRSASVGRRPW